MASRCSAVRAWQRFLQRPEPFWSHIREKKVYLGKRSTSPLTEISRMKLSGKILRFPASTFFFTNASRNYGVHLSVFFSDKYCQGLFFLMVRCFLALIFGIGNKLGFYGAFVEQNRAWAFKSSKEEARDPDAWKTSQYWWQKETKHKARDVVHRAHTHDELAPRPSRWSAPTAATAPRVPSSWQDTGSGTPATVPPRRGPCTSAPSAATRRTARSTWCATEPTCTAAPGRSSVIGAARRSSGPTHCASTTSPTAPIRRRPMACPGLPFPVRSATRRVRQEELPVSLSCDRDARNFFAYFTICLLWTYF